MPRLSRRSFLAASAALAARPAIGAVTPSTGGALDVIIVGAGAAGIAAARRIAAAGRPFALLEAADHIGGRCITDTRAFGVPYDLGAHWIHTPDLNPLTKLTPRRGIEVYRAPPSQKVRVGLRNAREGELEDLLAAEVRATRAIADAARKADTACEQALPNDLADWRSTIEFMLGPFGCTKDLAQVSTVDLARGAERNAASFCRQGLGALLASLAEGIPVQLSTPVTAITNTGRILAVTTPKGTLNARAVIVTASTNVIASGAIQFSPSLSREPFGRLSLGSYDHIALELTGNPLGLDSDDPVFEKSANTHTAALLANVSGTPLCMVDVAGAFGRDLSAQGEAAMVDFAAQWLAGLYGAEIKKSIGRTHATRWNSEPWTRGGASAAAPGGQSARRALLEPISEDIWYAGEAAHETLWGTVGGAWESGERAAAAVLQRLGPLKPAAPAETDAAPKRKPAAARARVEQRELRTYEVAPQYGGTPNIMRPER
jgi:monoamine oxidase